MNASYREFSQSGNKEDLIRREMGCITFSEEKIRPQIDEWRYAFRL